ncbi:MAG TPA: hypothetical protein VHI13_22000 [Candidatus Kapabacteria bacterium]|nr:hypothetical protein [Candidatus Kapabacteria bacterium]
MPFHGDDFTDSQVTPSAGTLRLWLGTPKQNVAGLPGLLGSSHSALQIYWPFVAVAIIIELTAATLTAVNLIHSPKVPILLATVASVVLLFLFLVDCWLAFVAHNHRVLRCYSNAVNQFDIRDYIDQREKYIQRRRLVDRIVGIIILMLCLAKWFFFVLVVNSLDNALIFYGALIAYTAVAAVHIYCTGYVVYEWLTNRALNADRKRSTANNMQLAARFQFFDRGIPPRLRINLGNIDTLDLELRGSRFSIRNDAMWPLAGALRRIVHYNDDRQQLEFYNLRLLWDSEIEPIVGALGLPPAVCNEVVQALRLYQLRAIHTPGNRKFIANASYEALYQRLPPTIIGLAPYPRGLVRQQPANEEATVAANAPDRIETEPGRT